MTTSSAWPSPSPMWAASALSKSRSVYSDRSMRHRIDDVVHPDAYSLVRCRRFLRILYGESAHSQESPISRLNRECAAVNHECGNIVSRRCRARLRTHLTVCRLVPASLRSKSIPGITVTVIEIVNRMKNGSFVIRYVDDWAVGKHLFDPLLEHLPLRDVSHEKVVGHGRSRRGAGTHA